MKNIIFRVITLLLICHIYSCETDYLITTSTDTYNEANWWQTESQAISSINGCYAVLRSSGIYNYREDNLTPNSYGMSTEIQLAQGNIILVITIILSTAGTGITEVLAG